MFTFLACSRRSDNGESAKNRATARRTAREQKCEVQNLSVQTLGDSVHVLVVNIFGTLIFLYLSVKNLRNKYLNNALKSYYAAQY